MKPHPPVDTAGATVPDLLADQARRHPDAVAVYGPTPVRYAALQARVCRIAAGLRARFGSHPGRIGLLFDDPVGHLVGLLGVLRAGYAAVPFDPAAPVLRNHDLIEIAGPVGVLTDRPDTVPAATVLLPDLETRPENQPAGGLPMPTGAGLAAVVFTSGTTGRPKGVLVPHRALANRIGWGQTVYPLGPGDVVLQSASVGFDFSLWELLAPLCAGAAVTFGRASELDGAGFADRLVADRVTALHLVPSVFAAMLPELARRPPFAHPRYVFFGGERLGAHLVEQAVALFPAAEILNQYGPTETCVDATYWRVDTEAGRSAVVPIGVPIAATSVSLRTDGTEVPEGEICIGGAGLAWGYLDDPRDTAEAFVPDPDPAVPGARLYRTGDLGTRRADGALLFLGRADDQVSVHGVRVEAGEVEAVAVRHPAVATVHVVPVRDPAGDRLALAFTGPVPVDELRAFLAARLPSAAVPRTIAAVDRIPLLPTGKVDRHAVVELVGQVPAAAPEAPDEAPLTPVERRIAEIWQRLLDVPAVARTDDFFTLGGHSLLAVQVRNHIRADPGAEVTLRDMIDFPVLGDLARCVETRLRGRR